MSWINNLHSANWNQAGGICLFAYILGCFTSGYYLVRLLAGQDIREIGSGSVGAKNVGRVLGKPGFFLTVLFDVGKGVAAVLVARQFSADDRLAALAMVGVVVGHIWPVQLRFNGGKGMATALGALLAYDPRLVLAFLVLFFCLFIVWRRTLLPGLFALAGVPLAAMLHHDNSIKVVFLSILAGLVMVAHRKNLVEEILHLPARRDLDPNPDQSEL